MSDLPTNDATVRAETDRKNAVVADIMRLFSELVMWRNVFAEQWEEVAALLYPSQRNTFYFNSFNFPGEKKTDQMVDATAMLALSRFTAISDSMITPRNQQWHGLESSNDYVMKDRASRMWFEDTTRRLFKARYSSFANFTSQNLAVFRSVGAFGNAGMLTDELAGFPQVRGLRYKAIPLGELFLIENHQGFVVGFIRWFKLSAYQAVKQFPGIPLPEAIKAALDKGSQVPFNFLHYVAPRDDYEEGRLDDKGKFYKSCYISVEARQLLHEGGYSSFPMATARYDIGPNEIYGRGPAMQVLPAIKTLNAEKRVFLKAAHRAADPVLLTGDDGLVDFSMRPGALNKGGMNSEGRPLVGTLPVGNIQISKEMMDEERSIIQSSFLVDLFQILTENPRMTVPEVVERINEKGILMAPTVGSLQSDYLGSLIPRELDRMSHMGMLLPMPPALKEARGEFEVIYTSPLSRAQRAGDVAGFLRSLQSTLELVNATQDASPLDVFNFDTAYPEVARLQGTPERWLADEEQINDKREARAQAQQKQQEIQAAPAAAAIMKAQAVAQKAGMVKK